jgi:hypothetical protein
MKKNPVIIILFKVDYIDNKNNHILINGKSNVQEEYIMYIFTYFYIFWYM